jgi:enoyl-CoA hydratase/carnithine racemase
MASRGPIALELGKEAIWRGLAMHFEQALRFETDLTLLLQTTKDRAEGVAAFIEKRTPKFTGT